MDIFKMSNFENRFDFSDFCFVKKHFRPLCSNFDILIFYFVIVNFINFSEKEFRGFKCQHIYIDKC